MTAPIFTAAEARAWAAEQDPPFRIVFNSKLARRITAKRMIAITLRRTVYVKADTVPVETLVHEFKHVLQGMVEFALWILFALAYLWEQFQHGYAGNEYEEEAKEYARVHRSEVIAWLTDYRERIP